jgi:Trk K+ transport system NAD-binding subunit
MIAIVIRDDNYYVPDGSFEIEAEDKIILLSNSDEGIDANRKIAED